MGNMLTFIDTRPFLSSGKFPDENFAREIMQLFTIGNWKMNEDGTYVKDATSGELELAYTNDDIEALARAWTG